MAHSIVPRHAISIHTTSLLRRNRGGDGASASRRWWRWSPENDAGPPTWAAQSRERGVLWRAGLAVPGGVVGLRVAGVARAVVGAARVLAGVALVAVLVGVAGLARAALGGDAQAALVVVGL